MKIDSGTTTVSTAGTEVQLSNTTNRVRWIKVKALAANSNKVYLGVSDVTATNGYELSAGNEIELDLISAGGTVAFNVFYLDAAANGDKACWWVVLDG